MARRIFCIYQGLRIGAKAKWTDELCLKKYEDKPEGSTHPDSAFVGWKKTSKFNYIRLNVTMDVSPGVKGKRD